MRCCRVLTRPPGGADDCRNGDCAAGAGVRRLDSRGCGGRFAGNLGHVRRCEGAMCASREEIGGAIGDKSGAPMRAWALLAESRPDWRSSLRWLIGGDGVMTCRSRSAPVWRGERPHPLTTRRQALQLPTEEAETAVTAQEPPSERQEPSAERSAQPIWRRIGLHVAPWPTIRLRRIVLRRDRWSKRLAASGLQTAPALA